MKEIKVKYHDKDMKKLKHIGGKSKSAMIDLYTSENIKIKAGEYKLIDLGVSIELPKGYKAKVIPRSSTFKKYGLLQANSVGLIDNDYNGDNDRWKMPIYRPITQSDIKDLFYEFIKDIIEDSDKVEDIENYTDKLFFNEMQIPKGTRLCQFEITPEIEDFKIISVDNLDNDNRDGVGSTGN